jgi:HEAT repeat protein
MRTGLALVAALVAAVSASGQTSETKVVKEVGGRTFEQWVKDIGHKDPSRREVAIQTILAFGPEKAYEATPALLGELRKHLLNPIDTSVRVNIAIALGAILGAKNNADPKLVKPADPKVVKEAITLLTRLVNEREQGIVRYRAAQALASIGLESRTAIDSLLPMLRDQYNFEVRQAGAMTLGKVAMDPKTGPSITAIIRLQALLGDPAYKVRQAACQSLAMLGPPPDPKDGPQKSATLNALAPVAKKDPEPVVQIWANVAIMFYTNKFTDENVAPIVEYLRNGDIVARMEAAQALSASAPMAKSSIPGLIGALGDVDPGVGMVAIVALGRMEAMQAIPALDKIAADLKNPLREPAKNAADFLRRKKAGASK